MANISPKLFQKAIQKGLKTALFTTSTAAIILSSSGVLGADVDVTGNAIIKDFATDGASVGIVGNFNNGDTLVMQGNFSLATGGNITVQEVNINGNAPTTFTFGHNAKINTDLAMSVYECNSKC